MVNPKLCPLAAANPQQEDASCLGEACACHVKMHKPRYMKADHYRIVDPEYFYRYVGCGLITHIPWELVKRKETPKANSEEEAQ
jgi:hypothetical protein